MRRLTFFYNYFMLALCAFFLASSLNAAENPKSWFERKSNWNGYDQFHFKIADRAAYIVTPQKPASGSPWVWRARFPGYHAKMDIALLGEGFHIAYVDVGGMFGSPQAMDIGHKFYEYLTRERGLAKKPALEGVSRGGLFVYNWAAKNPDKVACIYCDTPVCDFKSWPGGRGVGLGSAVAWTQCLTAYGITEDEALEYKKSPVDNLIQIANAKIPILHIVAENDHVVPPKENTYLLKAQLEKLGHKLELISVPKGTVKSNGHHFDHPQPQRVVRFISEHALATASKPLDVLRRSRRIVFLGDSITYAGHYVAFFDAWLQTQKLDRPPIVINVGLPSETVSGLSEAGHAGGKFPRPDLAERLDRVLSVTKPDLVFACYGINCGIYQPFSEERLEHYQRGIRQLKQKVEASGATLVLVTPPYYDDQRANNFFSYNAVLDSYAKWLLAQRKQGWLVADLHDPMAAEVALQRKKNPDFTFQPDAVHPNVKGHWFIASQLIRWFGDNQAASAKNPQEMLANQNISPAALALIRQRTDIRRDAYLASAAHKRPGIKTGLPVPEAEKIAQELSKRIQKVSGNTP